MKKIYLSVLLAGCLLGSTAQAQVVMGGIPWSISKKAQIELNEPRLITLPTPDYAKALKEDIEREEAGIPGKYRVTLAVEHNVAFGKTGAITYLSNGGMIWREKIVIPNSKGIKIPYDAFQVPEGVTYYILNKTGKQIIGGFNHLSNAPEKTMGHDLVVGDEAILELNIEPGVDIRKIELAISKFSGAYRGFDREIAAVENEDQVEIVDIGASDACHINAICPAASSWVSTVGRTAAHIYIFDGTSGGFCSGNLVNNTSNDKCIPYFLTASHCEGTNATSNESYKDWEFTFRFMVPLCAGGGTPPQTRRVTGANFVARSPNTIPPGQQSGPLFGDFLLLRLRDQNNQMRNWDLYLGGWDRTNELNHDTAWVAFHHPAGDVMKFTKMRPLQHGSFNTDSIGTHWGARQREGGAQGGSSGSGLFSARNSRLIGPLSGGSGQPCATSRWSLYHKFGKAWDYFDYGDGTSTQRLKDHLDPINSDVQFVETVPFNCGTSVNSVNPLETAIDLYPNPSTGIVTAKINMQEASDLRITVVSIMGVKCMDYLVKYNGGSTETSFDLSSLADGIYLVKFDNGVNATTRKVVLRK